MFSLWGFVLCVVLVFSSGSPEQQAMMKDLNRVSSWDVFQVEAKGSIKYTKDEKLEDIINGIIWGIQDEDENHSKEVEEISYKLTGYVDWTSNEADININFKGKEYPKGRIIKIVLKDNIAYLNKDYYLEEYPNSIFNLTDAEYIGTAVDVDLQEIAQIDSQEMVEKYRRVLDMINMKLPLKKSNDTYILELDHTEIAEIFSKVAHQVVDNIESIIKEFISAYGMDLVGGQYNPNTHEYEVITYDNINSYYDGELREDVESIVKKINAMKWIERINYYIQGSIYGTNFKMTTRINDHQFVSDIKGHFSLLKCYLLDIDCHTLIKPCKSQKVSVPKLSCVVSDIGDCTHPHTLHIDISHQYSIDEAKAFITNSENDDRYFIVTDGKKDFLLCKDCVYLTYSTYIQYNPENKKCYLMSLENLDEKAYYEAYALADEVGTKLNSFDYMIDETKLQYLDVIPGDGYCLIPISELEKVGFMTQVVEKENSKVLEIFENPFK